MSRLQLISIGYILGILVGNILTDTPIYYACVGALLLAGAGLHKSSAVRLFLFAGITGVGVAIMHTDISAGRPPDTNCIRSFEGTVETIPVSRNGHRSFTLQLHRLSTCVRSKAQPTARPNRNTAFITVLHPESDIPQVGDTIRFTAFCQVKRPYAHTFEPMMSPHRYFTAVVPRGNHFAIIDTPGPMGRWIRAQRQRVVHFFDTHLSAPNAAVAKALTVGERSHLTTEQKTQFRATGTAHLLAVSGLHLSILVLFSYGILHFTLRRIYVIAAGNDISRYCAAICLPLICGFVFLSGAHPPVIRAALMLGAILIGKIFRLQSTASQSVCIAAVFMLSISPSLICDVGFQLSFVTVFAFIILLRPTAVERSASPTLPNAPASLTGWRRLWSATRPIRHRIFTYLATTLRVSTIAAAVTSPFLAFHFHVVPVFAPFTNLVLVPFVSIIVMPIVLLTCAAILSIPPLAPMVSPICEHAIRLFSAITQAISPLSVTVSTPTFAVQFAVGMACISLLFMLRRKWAIGLLFLLFCGVVWIMHLVWTPPLFKDDALTFDFLDMGQGDATVITFPNGAHWLVDGGGTAHQDIGRQHLVPALQSLGISRLDKVILTHPDPDHLLGLPAVLQHFSVSELWENGQGREEPAHPVYKTLLKTARQKDIPIHRGNSLCGPHRVGKVLVSVLHPCESHGSYAPERSFNDNSIVLHFRYRHHTVLLPGDLSKEGEQHLLQSYPLHSNPKHSNASLRADLLKLGHHGSAGASSMPFLTRVQPKFALASCGFHNRYHFPAKSIKKRLNATNTTLYRTDTQGWIRYVLTPGAARFQLQKKHHAESFWLPTP